MTTPTRWQVRLVNPLAETIREISKREHRSIQQQLTLLIEIGLEHYRPTTDTSSEEQKNKSKGPVIG